jgi:glycosyltransferase involved in cell wall biosynthesis
MILGIDATSIRTGGVITHFVQLLRVANPAAQGFSQVIVWGGRSTLDRIEDRPWLVKSYQPMLDRRLLFRAFWQRFRLSKLARLANCDVLFVPNGSYVGDFHPMVTMSRNMLPFEPGELRRFGWSWMALKCVLQRWTLSCTFRRANGLIFLTQYAQEKVKRTVKRISGRLAIIPHGVDERFARPPRKQRPISQYSVPRPFRILYVSMIDVYKHQWQAAEAVAQLRKCGFPVELDLVGPAYPPALKRLRSTIERLDLAHAYLRYFGAVEQRELPAYCAQADLYLFASSCENMPNILLEGMASGLPIACSNRGPMPEVLGDGGVYFDPEKSEDIARALKELIQSTELREAKASISFSRAQAYSWQYCASETFGFLAVVARAYPNKTSLRKAPPRCAASNGNVL